MCIIKEFFVHYPTKKNGLIMKLEIFLRRKLKGIFLKIGFHKLVLPFNGLLSNIIYMAQFSKWRRDNSKLDYNDFYNSNVKYEDRFLLHEYVFKKFDLSGPIDFFEFGVADGDSFRWWVEKNNHTSSKFFGFDTFTGLPEDFGVMKKSDYDRQGEFPDITDKRVLFVKGMFQDSLPGFMESYQRQNQRLILHLDADLYSATLYVLTRFAYLLRRDDIIIFDEFGVPTHEFKAFSEFCHAYGFKYEVLAAVNNYLQVAIIVK